MRLTRQAVAALTIPPGKPYAIFWDEMLPGFGVRVNPTGKVWVVQYRVNGKSVRETLGRVDVIPLDAAREKARQSLARVQLGGDPRSERAAARAESLLSFGAVADRYLTRAKTRLKPRSYEEVERHLLRHWGAFQELPINKVGRALIAARLEDLANQSGPVASNRARAAISAMFTYAMSVGLAEGNPVIGTIKIGKEVSRDHVINDDELAAIWNSTAVDTDHSRIVKLLMLTAQRRDEVAAMRWTELDFTNGVWTIPAARTKNGLVHQVPLSNCSAALLMQIPRQNGRDFVFGEGRGGFSGWSKSKLRLDQRIALIDVHVRPWRLHDLRRTAATRMADFGVQPHVIEAVLNHISGHKAGVAGIYNRATYADAKRSALVLWSEHILRLGGAAESKCVNAS